ncbi:MAG: glutathione S-transferase family protein [Alphaproteobacteria bacterium]
MKLYGVYLSPYTRRVAIALTLLDMPFDHDGLRVFETPEPVRAHNPLARVPTLVMDDGSALVESWAILDEIDRLAGPDRALAPAEGEARRDVFQIAAYGVGIMEKAQWAFYERRFHPEEKVHEPWEAHNDAQVVAGLKHLDGIAKSAGDGWLAGTETISHADISAAVAHSFARTVRPKLEADKIAPNLAAFTTRCEALPAFKACPLP